MEWNKEKWLLNKWKTLGVIGSTQYSLITDPNVILWDIKIPPI